MRSLRARFFGLTALGAAIMVALAGSAYALAAWWIRATVPAERVEEVLAGLAGGFALLAVAAALAMVVVAIVHLRPLGDPLRRVLAQLDAAGDAPIDAAGLPDEIGPVVQRVLALRGKLAAALAREREFTGHVAHELRTPLAVLQTGLELAQRRQKHGSDAHAQLAELLETVEEMRRLIENLLLLARVEREGDRVEVQPVPVREVVEAVWRRLADKARARELTFHDQLAEDHTLPADRAKLRIVVQNLLANAVSYTDRGGEIVVRAPDGGGLEVWDSGPAPSDEELRRMFDRLWRADRARTDATAHAGIGLSLSRALARQMRMELTAERPAAGGIAFVLRCP